MNIISYDNLDNILSYLYVSDYKYINKYLYLKADYNASNIIKKYIKKYLEDITFIEKTLYNSIVSFDRNTSNKEYSVILRYIKLDLKKNRYITKRDIETVNIIINNAEIKFQQHFNNVLETNNLQIQNEFTRNYILNSDLAEVESRLIDLSFYILRKETKQLNKIQLKFINIFYKDFLHIPKSTVFLENKIKKLVIKYISLKYNEFKCLTPFKEYMYKFVIYYIINNILNEMKVIYVDKLYQIYKKYGFNSLVDSVEIDIDEYLSTLC